ncbi:MIP/aquaporin family protein [Micromonospora sp. WMMD1082]|uniref:aquaporin n=1 Tax=Micromonospora sp. WMMD1082 TaxID=3016104 RepID=UPI0024172E1A|nr:MIP/aquaporin family protein [Micromonospora sp. WMMD1082]MDG4798291.1 aquaporin family protein [Micromonospora sp. WMMD1082]
MTPDPHRAVLRRASAELVGTGLLVTAVVGSGIAASRLSPTDVGLQLLENSIATAFALGALILIFGPVSGAHLNPVVSVADWWLGRRAGTGLPARDLAAYLNAQILGAIGGTVLAHLMFGLPAVTISTRHRDGGGLWLAEVVATGGLLLLIAALTHTHRQAVAPAAVGAWIGAAYWFTASTAFANPAVTIGRMFTDTFAGITPTSALGFVTAQLAATALALTAISWWYPTQPRTAASVEWTPARPEGAPARIHQIRPEST